MTRNYTWERSWTQFELASLRVLVFQVGTHKDNMPVNMKHISNLSLILWQIILLFLPLFCSPLSQLHLLPLSSIHPTSLLLPALLFLSESRAAHRSILIEVSWGQTIHSCFTIKCEQRRETRRKEEGGSGKQRRGKICVVLSCMSRISFVHLLHRVYFPVIFWQCLNSAKTRWKGG